MTEVHYVDKLAGGVTVMTWVRPVSERWFSAIIGGPADGWESAFREEDNPAEQHARAVALALQAGES